MQKKALVLGWGLSGKAAAPLLVRRGFSVVVADRKRALLQGCEFPFFADDCNFPLKDVSLCVISPGIVPSHPLLQKVKSLGIEVVSEIALALEELSGQKMLAVTGSNGKTTTVLLAEHILRSAGKKAKALGNVGCPLSTYALHPDPEEILMVELSSFQLESLPIHPYFEAAMILNITPNHLNRHASMEEYAGAKLRLGSCLKKDGQVFVSQKVQKEYLPQGTIFDFEAPQKTDPCLGQAEWQNKVAAKTLCHYLGVSDEECSNAFFSFRKPPHRIEWVDEIDAVVYYNDSKASSVEATMHAVRLFERSLLLIAGGVDKGASYRPWIECFRGKVKKIALYGEAALKIAQELQGHFSLSIFQTLQEAFQDCAKESVKGDVVLLSPGCSSYDQFTGFEARGDAFKHMVRGISHGSKKNHHRSGDD